MPTSTTTRRPSSGRPCGSSPPTASPSTPPTGPSARPTASPGSVPTSARTTAPAPRRPTARTSVSFDKRKTCHSGGLNYFAPLLPCISFSPFLLSFVDVASDGHRYVWAANHDVHRVDVFDLDTGDYAGYTDTCSTPLDMSYHPTRREMCEYPVRVSLSDDSEGFPSVVPTSRARACRAQAGKLHSISTQLVNIRGGRGLGVLAILASALPALLSN